MPLLWSTRRICGLLGINSTMVAGISSPPRPRRCGVFLSKPHVRKLTEKHGGGRVRVGLEDVEILNETPDRVLALDSALERLASEQPEVVAVVNLRYFAGLSIEQTASALGISVRKTNRHWAFAKAWLYQVLGQSD